MNYSFSMKSCARTAVTIWWRCPKTRRALRWVDVWKIFHKGIFENITAQPHKTLCNARALHLYSIWISAGTRPILIEVHVFPQFLQANTGRVPWLGNDRFLSDSSHSLFICCRSFLSLWHLWHHTISQLWPICGSTDAKLSLCSIN
jgi:hypothetical protein